MAFIEASKTGSGGSGDGVPVGALVTFKGNQLPEGYEPDETEEQVSIQQLTDNLSGFKFYPTGTQLVALVADDSFYKDANDKYVLANSTTGQTLIDNVTYKALASTEETHGEVGADSASPFSNSGIKESMTFFYLPIGNQYFKVVEIHNSNQLIGSTLVSMQTSSGSDMAANGEYVTVYNGGSQYQYKYGFFARKKGKFKVYSANMSTSSKAIRSYTLIATVDANVGDVICLLPSHTVSYYCTAE